MQTVLLIDDEPANLAVLADVLSAQYRVRAATSGRLGIAAATSAPTPDLILLDVMMPDLDGYAVIKALQAEATTRQIPVIFVSALSDEHHEEYGLKLGAVDYIYKPISAAVVQARVAGQLELKSARDRLTAQNAELEAEVARRVDEIAAIQEVGIQALAELAETRDPETGNHIRRTKAYVLALAGELRAHPRFSHALAGNRMALLGASAPLHDIGKVGIPDLILLKPGPLTKQERALMQTHAALGADAIERALHHGHRSVDFLNIAKEIARWHHEKWDGSGYPDGLAGEQIPVSARLMALADVFDALVSPRIYKRAHPFEQACRAIEAERGTHFDPDVVDAFVALRAQFKAIAALYAEAPQAPA
ncbi:response regulator [Niveibacterium sp. 24ML]|uniref:HD-GYP domain-containing protein n=1 Tax=Niveibacterium sp. 24ML TaxID=2985512 RepID=UPI00226EE833|nr:HD domain-containing phosphohydrolase [Niveibacterium sp. 24ML]MCX9157482.1 response regulator [Niveibacterium sp. 24ML]